MNHQQMEVDGEVQSPTTANNDVPRGMHSFISRPITQNQLEAIRTGSHVQPGSSLGDFFKDLEKYTPTIPDSVALYYMRKNGIDNPDPRIVRLFSLSAQKFIADIALDAMQQARIKGLGQIRKGARDSRETRFTLTGELLETVLQEYGIALDTPPYYQ